jgi:hypothetical protein
MDSSLENTSLAILAVNSQIPLRPLRLCASMFAYFWRRGIKGFCASVHDAFPTLAHPSLYALG